MKKLLGRLFIASLMVSVSASAIYAQNEGGRGNRGGERGQGRQGFGFGMRGGNNIAGLLRHEQVEKELKIDAAQKEEIDSARKANEEEFRKIFGAGPGQGGPGQGGPGQGGPGRGAFSEENRQKLESLSTKLDEKLAEILDPDQFRRLLGIYAQMNSPRCLSNPFVAKEIGLSDAQVAEVEKVQEELGAKLREARSSGGDARSEEARAKMQAAVEENANKALAVLSDEQKKKFEELKGAKIDLPQGGFGGPGFGGPGFGGPGRGGRDGQGRGNRGGDR